MIITMIVAHCTDSTQCLHPLPLKFYLLFWHYSAMLEHTYNSQNYASIIGQDLLPTLKKRGDDNELESNLRLEKVVASKQLRLAMETEDERRARLENDAATKRFRLVWRQKKKSKTGVKMVAITQLRGWPWKQRMKEVQKKWNGLDLDLILI